jgi:hypothetical protein
VQEDLRETIVFTESEGGGTGKRPRPPTRHDEITRPVRVLSWMEMLIVSVGVGGIVGCAVIASVSVAMARQPIIPPVPTALAVFAFHLCTADG